MVTIEQIEEEIQIEVPVEGIESVCGLYENIVEIRKQLKRIADALDKIWEKGLSIIEDR